MRVVSQLLSVVMYSVFNLVGYVPASTKRAALRDVLAHQPIPVVTPWGGLFRAEGAHGPKGCSGGNYVTLHNGVYAEIKDNRLIAVDCTICGFYATVNDTTLDRMKLIYTTGECDFCAEGIDVREMIASISDMADEADALAAEHGLVA